MMTDLEVKKLTDKKGGQIDENLMKTEIEKMKKTIAAEL